VRETKIKLRHGDTLLINTLNGSVCMGYLRRFLAGGFQVGLAVGGGWGGWRLASDGSSHSFPSHRPTFRPR